MKNFIYSKNSTLLLALLTLLCCANGSIVDTTNNSESTVGPDVNFYGVLEDHVNTVDVTSILIGGKYREIPVYSETTSSTQHEISHQNIDPQQNKTLINLEDIISIALEHPNNPSASTVQINGKAYIKIVVESLQKTKKIYIVESTRKITCKEIDKSLDVHESPILKNRNVNFIHVKKLLIKGYKSDFQQKSSQIAPISKISEKPTLSQEKKDFKNNAAELLHAIEENVKNLPMDNSSAFEAMRSTILTLLKSLRDQLQKFLDMIK